MEKSWNNITIALAGVCQAARLVEQLAKTGYLQTSEFETAVSSLFITEPTSTIDVFGSVAKLRVGFETLDELLNHHRDPKNADLLRYILGILHLQGRLKKRSDLLYVIGSRIDKARTQVEHFGYTHDNVVSNIADIYSDTISKFQFRIQVSGEYSYLQQPRVAGQIRTLLLSAIRAATLWRQVGGTRWQLLLYRSRVAQANKVLLSQAKAH